MIPDLQALKDFAILTDLLIEVRMPVWFIFDVETEVQTEIDPSQLAVVVKSLSADKLSSTVFWQEGWADWRPLTEIPELMAYRRVLPPPPPRKVPPPFQLGNLVEVKPAEPVTPQDVTIIAAAPESMTPQEIPVVAAKEPVPMIPQEIPIIVTKESEPVIPKEIPVVAKEPEPVAVPQDIPIVAKEPAPAPSERRRARREAVRFRVMFTWDQVVFRTFSKNLSPNGLLVEHPVPESIMNREVECFISSPDLKSAVRFKAILIGDSRDRLSFRFVDGDPHAKRVLTEWFEQVRNKRGVA